MKIVGEKRSLKSINLSLTSNHHHHHYLHSWEPFYLLNQFLNRSVKINGTEPENWSWKRMTAPNGRTFYIIIECIHGDLLSMELYEISQLRSIAPFSDRSISWKTPLAAHPSQKSK
ncbi:hypothetical protein TNIN_185031 [Trichonephila inaurata madagascariensis]|uniref:Uncharacterized protein n=1 Tax=Trichonephila inaurata madagascariensis TaxID=2747483 RepID=A0A8X6I2V6_9ARAC|nr:hypothetical protein TNIN_185031 [Trichonephila inaurata madagascariensis]